MLVDAHRASDVSFVFRGHVEGGELEPQFGEIAEAGWVDRDEIAAVRPRGFIGCWSSSTRQAGECAYLGIGTPASRG